MDFNTAAIVPDANAMADLEFIRAREAVRHENSPPRHTRCGCGDQEEFARDTSVHIVGVDGGGTLSSRALLCDRRKGLLAGRKLVVTAASPGMQGGRMGAWKAPRVEEVP